MKPVTYASYLELDALLNAQKPKSDGPEHDEMLFIVIHQVYELWFKQILHELDYLTQLMDTGDVPRMSHTLVRVLKILKVQVAQLDILETMTPLEFLSFRERLESASGFQSYQFRELEFLLGHKRLAMVEHFPAQSEGRNRLDKRFSKPSLWDVFLKFLAAQNYQIPQNILDRNVTEPYEANQDVQAVLIDLYRNNPNLLSVCELLVDFDEGIQEWRYRHVKMVERTIGSKHGSGGSSGVGYLSSTLFQPVFPDLWAIRSEF
jgi:tryptophan 2,3-dioxygenase